MRDRWGTTPDTVTYTAAISACERGANCSVALDLLDLMRVRAWGRFCVGVGGWVVFYNDAQCLSLSLWIEWDRID